MKDREYPFTAYVRTPTMLVKRVVLIRSSQYVDDLHFTESGHSYTSSQLHATAEDAIARGRSLLDDQRKKLATTQANIDKREVNLNKATQNLGN